MIPLRPTDTLESFLSGAGTHSVVVIFYDVSDVVQLDKADYRRDRQITASNGATDITCCAAPRQGYTRHIEEIYFNPSSTITITLQYDVSGTETPFIKQAVTADETLHYGNGSWKII